MGDVEVERQRFWLEGEHFFPGSIDRGSLFVILKWSIEKGEKFKWPPWKKGG